MNKLYKTHDVNGRIRTMTEHHFIYLYKSDLYKEYLSWLKTKLALKHGWIIKNGKWRKI